MRTVSASFDTYDEVTAAVDGLSDMGVPCTDITVVTPRRDAMTKIAEGVGLGAAIGGVGVLLAGFVAPGLGSLFGVGWPISLLAGAGVGGIAGGVIAFLAGARAEVSDAQVNAEGLQPGGTLLVARIHDDEAGKARAILLRCGAIDTDTRRGEYAADGWDSFVAKDIWDEDIGSEDVRLTEGRADRDQPPRRRVA